MPDLEVTDPQNGRRYTVEWLSQDAPTAADLDAIVLEGRRRHAPTVVKAARKVQAKAANPLMRAFAKPKPEAPYKPRDLAESIFGPPQPQVGDKPEVAQRHKSWQKDQLRRFDEPVRSGTAQIPSTQAEWDPFGRNEVYSERMHGPAAARNVLGGGKASYHGLSMIQEGLGSAAGAAINAPARSPLSTMVGDMLASGVPSTIKGMTPQASPEEQNAALLNVLLALGLPALGKAFGAMRAGPLDDVAEGLARKAPLLPAEARVPAPPFDFPEPVQSAPAKRAAAKKPKYLTKRQKAAWLDESKSPQGYDPGEAPSLLGMAKAREPVVTPEQSPVPIIAQTHTPPRVPDKGIPGEKASKATGLTPTQTKVLKLGLLEAREKLPQNVNAKVRTNLQGEKFVDDFGGAKGIDIDVPGDGTFTVYSKTQADNLYKAVGGKPPETVQKSPLADKRWVSKLPHEEVVGPDYVGDHVAIVKTAVVPDWVPSDTAARIKKPFDALAKPDKTSEVASIVRVMDDDMKSVRAIRLTFRDGTVSNVNPQYWSIQEKTGGFPVLGEVSEALGQPKGSKIVLLDDDGSPIAAIMAFDPKAFGDNPTLPYKSGGSLPWKTLKTKRTQLSTKTPSPAESLLAASEPKTGGMGKKAGAVQAPALGMPRAGALGDVAEGVKEGVGKAVAGLAGNAFNKLNVMGEAGKKAAQTLKQVLAGAESRQAGWGERIRQSIRSEFAMAAVNKRWHALETDMADMYERGVFDSPNAPKGWNSARYGPYASAKKIADEWTAVNREIAQEGEALDVLTRHFADDDPNPKLVGETVYWNENGQSQSGTVASVAKGRVELADGRTLDGGRDFYARSLTTPEHYFPRKLKPEVMDQIRRGKGRFYDMATKHLVATGQAADAAAAKKMLADVFESYQPGPFGGPARLERPRLGFMLPKEFYNRNFQEVVQSHIGQASKRLAQAEVWGRDQERLTEILDDVGDYGDKLTAAREIERALGEPGGPWNLLSGLEGAYTAVSKMGASPTTVIVQPTQMANTFGKFGAKAFVQGVVRQFSKLKRAEVTVSGAVDQDVLTLLGRDDLTGVLKAAVHLPLKPIGWADRMFRTHSALAADAYIESAAKRLKVGTGGKILDNWAARDMKDWFGFTDEDLLRIQKSGLTGKDRTLAMHGGSASNVRARPADLPSFTATPWGRILLRLRTFTYGQGQVLGSNIVELKNGNPVPLTRQLVGSLVVGYGVKKAKDIVLGWLDPEREAKMRERAQKAGWEGWQSELAEALSESGMLGFYGAPLKAYEAKAKYGIDFGTAIGDESKPVIADTIERAGRLALDAFRSPEDKIDTLKKAGLKFTHDEVAAIRRWGGLFGMDKPAGPKKPAKSKTSSPSSLESALRSL